MRIDDEGYFWPATLEELIEATETPGSFGAIKLSSELMVHLIRRVLKLEEAVGVKS